MICINNLSKFRGWHEEQKAAGFASLAGSLKARLSAF